MKQLHHVPARSWFLALCVGLVYGWGATSIPRLHYEDPLIAFTLLMVVHAGAHWTSFLLVKHRRLQLLYFIVQAVLVLAISAFARDVLVVSSLYLLLMGEAILMLGLSRLAVLVVVSDLTLFTLTVWWLGSKSQITYAFAAMAVPLPFVIGSAVFLARQAQMRERTLAELRRLEAVQAKEQTLATERQRMARELHDTLAQGVAGLLLQLEAVDAQLVNGHPERAQTIVQQAMGRARAVLGDARRAIDNLRTETADQDNLAKCLREEVNRFISATGIPCTFRLDLSSALPADLCEHALRAVSEGLANIARHAQARHAWVQVAEHMGTLDIEVRDNGSGFDLAAVAGQAGHYGLLGLRERARLAGGNLELISTPGEGTTIRLCMPIHNGGSKPCSR